MSCNNLGIVGRIVNISTPAIVRGSDSTIEVQIYYKPERSAPYKFENFAGATGYFTTITGVYQASVSLSSADLGKLIVDLPASATSTLMDGEEQTFQVDFEDDLGLSKILFDRALAVVIPLA